MLSRMYQRWAERKRWKVETLDSVDGEVAGIKSITFKFTGSFAYGYTKAEKGVHQQYVAFYCHFTGSQLRIAI